MVSPKPEMPLLGGRVTQGVVRIADTVRRPPTPNSPFVHAVLRHLQASGFAGVPGSLGSDEAGRDIFSFIEGEVPRNLAWHDDVVLFEAARLIRGYHDATATLLTSLSAQAVGLEVVCHNDLSPCNFVFQSGRPVAIIDFDAAAPGHRLHDLGYAAWMWLDLGNDDIGTDRQHRRLEMFVAAYDPGIELMHVVDAIMRRQHILIAEAKRTGDAAMGRWASDCLQWMSHYVTATIP